MTHTKTNEELYHGALGTIIYELKGIAAELKVMKITLVKIEEQNMKLLQKLEEKDE